MEFDKSNVYTAVNADELHEDDIVCIADMMRLLRTNVQECIVGQIVEIAPEDSCFRFVTGSGRYSLAYLVCPARNAEAFWKWRYGLKKPKLEVQLLPNGEWTKVTDKMIKSDKDFWFHHAIRVKDTRREGL